MQLDLSDTRDTTEWFQRYSQRSILIALAVPTEGSGGRILRLLRHPALWILAAGAVAGIELGCLVVALLAHFHVIPRVEIPGVCAILPSAVAFCWMVMNFPHAYLVEHAPALTQLAAQGDRRVVSPAASQPPLLSPDDLPAVDSSIGPIWRGMSKELELSNYPGLLFLLLAAVECLVFSFVALVFAILLFFFAPVILGIAVLAIGLALGAGGIRLFHIRRIRRGNWRAWITRPLQVTVRADGVSWEEGDTSATVHTETLAWRQVEGFCMVEFQRDVWEGPYRVYLLWSGTSQLAWEWTSRMPAKQRAACDLLVRLAATQTGRPLSDLAPGVSALAAALQETQSLDRPRAEQPITRSLPPSLAVPLEELRASSWRCASLMLGALALILLWGGLVITGSIFGLLAGLLVIVALVVLWRRRRSAAA